MDFKYQQVKAIVGREARASRRHRKKVNTKQEAVVVAMAYTYNSAKPRSRCVVEMWKDIPLPTQIGTDTAKSIVGALRQRASFLELSERRFYRNGQSYIECVRLADACNAMIRCLEANKDDFNAYVEKLEEEEQNVQEEVKGN